MMKGIKNEKDFKSTIYYKQMNLFRLIYIIFSLLLFVALIIVLFNQSGIIDNISLILVIVFLIACFVGIFTCNKNMAYTQKEYDNNNILSSELVHINKKFRTFEAEFLYHDEKQNAIMYSLKQM